MTGRTEVSVFRLNPTLVWPAGVVGGSVLALAAIGPALRIDHIVFGPERWLVWPVTPGISLGIFVVAWLYVAGQRNQVTVDNERYAAWRHLAFFSGLAALFLALQSPIEPLSDHLFFVHQIEHMLLRTSAPMLLVLAAPQAALLRGLPNGMRRYFVRPLLVNPVSRLFGVIGHPAVASAIFIGTTYFWMIPRYHDLAILDEPVHYLWHTSLLLSGLLFFWRILDVRPYPYGASLGVRLAMFWTASVGNILLGSYLTLKHGVLYHAYDELGRLSMISPAVDENYGGLIMWIPGSMMFAATAMLMIYRWAQQEERSLRRSAAVYGAAIGAAEFRLQRSGANRKMAIGLVCFVLTVAALTFTTVLTYHYGEDIPGLPVL